MCWDGKEGKAGWDGDNHAPDGRAGAKGYTEEDYRNIGQPRSNPMRGEVNPMRGEVNPMRGEVNPMRGEVNPMRGEVNPMRGERGEIGERGITIKGDHE